MNAAMTPARLDYYLGTYERHRERIPLPPGWDSEVMLYPDHGSMYLWFWTPLHFRLFNTGNRERAVWVHLDTPGLIRINLCSDDGLYLWTAKEGVELLRQLIGLELRPEDIGVIKYGPSQHKFTVPDTVFNR